VRRLHRPLFANAEMGSRQGRHVIWSREGSWNGVKLDGLNVIAVVRTGRARWDDLALSTAQRQSVLMSI